MFTVARRRLAPDASGGTLTSSADTTSTPSTLLVPLQCWTHTDSGNGETCIVTAYAVQSLRVTLPDSSINGAAAEGPHGGMVWELLWFCDRSSTDIDGRTTPSGSKRRDKQKNRICRKQFVYQNVDPSDLWPWCASAAAARSATASMSSSGTETTVQGGVLFFSARCIAIATERGSTVPRLDTFHLMESSREGDGKQNWLRQQGAITLGTDTAPAAASRLLYIDSAQTTTHAATVPVVYVTEHSLAAPQRPSSSSGRAARRWLQVCSAKVCAPAAGAPPVTVSPGGECFTIPIEGGEDTEQFVRAWQWMLMPSNSASHRGSLLAVLPRHGGATSSMTDGSATGKGIPQQRFACIRCADEGSIGISLPRPAGGGGGEEDEEDDLSALDPEEVLQRLTTDWTTVCIVPATPTGRRVTDFGQLMKEGPMILHVVTPGDVVHASPSPLTRIKTPGLYESQLSWADVRRGGTASALARRLRVPRGLTAWWGTQPVALAASPSSFTAIPTNSAYAATQPLPPLSAMLYNKATQEWELATVWCQDGHGELAQYTSLSTTIHTKLGLALDDGKQGRDVSAVGEALVESLISERFTPHLAHHKQQLHAGSSKSATSGVAQDLVAGLSSRLLDGAATDAPLREMYAAMVHHAAVLRGEEQAVEGHSFIHYASRVRDNAEHALSFSPTNKQWHTLSQIVSALCLELLRQMSWRATSDTAAAAERAVIALLLGARGPLLHAAVQSQASQPSLEDAHLIHGLQVVLALATEDDTWTTLEGKHLSAMWVRRMLLLYACRKSTVPLEMLTDDIISEAVVVDGNSISESLVGMVCALWQAVDESTLLEMVDAICYGDGSGAGGCLSPAEVHQLLDGARGALAPMLGDALPPSLIGLVPLAAAVAAATTGAGFMHSGADACLGAVDAVLATFNTASLALPLCLRRGPQCAALTRYPWCSMPPLVFFYFWLRVADAVDTEEQQTGHASYLKESAHILWFIIQGHAEIAADVMAALTRIANEEGGAHHSASSSPPGLTLDAFASVMHASELQEGASRLTDAQTDTWAERCVARVLHLCFASASGKALRSLVLAAAMASVPLANTGKDHGDDGDAPPNAIQLATMFKAASEASGDTLTRTLLLLLQSSKEKEEGHSVSIRSGAVVSRALRAVSLRIWNFVHQKDPEAVTNAVLCDKLYEAFATLRENAVFKMHSSSAADSTASTTLLSFLRVYFIHDYPLLLSGVSAVYCRFHSSPQQEQRRCVQYDSILSPSQQQQQQQRRSVEELLMVGEVCERVRHTLLRLLSLYGDRSLCARLLGELFKLVATAADLADGDASDQQQHVTAVQKRGGVFFLSPPAAFFISSQVQSAETGRFVVSTAVIHRELHVFVHQQMQLPAVPEVDDESYMRHQVSTFINDVADACEGVSACLGSCMPIYEPALSLIILSVVGETVPPCYQAVTQGVIGSAAAKIMRPLRPEEKQQCLLAVRPSFAARIPQLAPHGHQHKQQTAKRYEDSEVHRRVSHRVLPSVLATVRAMRASSSCDDPSGNLSRRRASADTPLPAVITITNSLLSVLGVSSPTSTIAPHAMPHSHTTNNNSNNNNSSASTTKTLSKGDAAVSILVREEKFRRDQLAGELLAGYTAWLHSTPFQEALGTLYVAMRMERRRRELLKHTLEQVDIINTFEARYFTLAKEMLLEEERRVRDESDRRRVDERRALAEREEEDRLGVEAQCSTERSALWALAAQQEDVLLTEDSSRWAWRDVEVSDRQALIKACLMERQRLGMQDTLLAEEEILLSIPREPHAPQQAPPPSSSTLREGEDDNMGGIVGGFSLVMGASEGLLRGFNQFQSKLRDTVAPPPLQRAQPDHSTGADALMGNYVASGINKGKAPSNEKVVADEGWDWLCDEKEEVHGDKNNSNPPTRNAAADDGWGWSDDDDARTTMPVRGTTSAAQIGPPTGATTQLSRQVRHVPPEEEEEEDTSTMCKKPRPHHKKRKGLQAEVIVAPVASSTPVLAEEVIDASTQATQTVPTARNIYDALHDAAEGDHDDDNDNRQNVRKALDDSVGDGWGWEDEDGDDFSGISGARPREDVAAAAVAAAAHSALLSLEGTERALLTVEEVVGREGLKRHRIFQYL